MVSFSIFQDYFDEYELLVNKNGNGGDTANRMGLLVLTSYILSNIGKLSLYDLQRAEILFARSIKYLMPYPGIGIRHPGQSFDAGKKGVRDLAYWNDWLVFSRDQWLPFVMGLALTKEYSESERMINALKRHFGIHQNGDLTGPQHWAFILRLSINWPNKAILVFGDFFLMLAMLITAIKKDASDAIMGFNMLMIAQSTRPTIFSRAAHWIAKHLMNMQALFTEYFGNSRDPGPPFHVYAKPIFDRYF